jgi:hypothetical protein
VSESRPRPTGGALRTAAKFLVVVAATCLSVAAAAREADAAGAKPVGGARALAVSVPPDPVPIAAGTTAKTFVRVVNPNAAAVRVVIESRLLSLLDDGKVAVGAGPDARWERRARFPSGQLTIPAQGYLDIPLTVRVPRRLPPDLYFIGFLVTPVPTRSGSIQVINQIGSFVTIDVPGARMRKLTGRFRIPGLIIGSEASGSLRLANVGKASVRFWGENDTTSSPGGKFRQIRLDPSLLPVGRSRSITFSSRPAWPIGLVTITAHITYPGRTEAATREMIFHRRVLVISPWVLIGLVLLLLLAAVARWCVSRIRKNPVETSRRRPAC